MNGPKVLIVMGSAADESCLKKGIEHLRKMDIPYVVKVASAHRTPERVAELLKQFEGSLQVIIGVAGHAAHLAGVLASKTNVPVLGVPVGSSALSGMDALLSTVQMPGGIPVAGMAIGSSGLYNAACFAHQILALNDPALKEKWVEFRKEMADKVAQSSREVEAQWNL